MISGFHIFCVRGGVHVVGVVVGVVAVVVDVVVGVVVGVSVEAVVIVALVVIVGIFGRLLMLWSLLVSILWLA